jgi:polysaccharide export outer membrane protein
MSPFLRRRPLPAIALALALSPALAAPQSAPSRPAAPAAPPAVPAAKSLPSPFAMPPTSDQDYSIGAQDVLEIREYQLKELDVTRRVDNDGSVTLPLLGKVSVGGLNPQQAEEAISLLLRERDLVKLPQVSVNIKEYVSRRVSIQGAVDKPGLYPMLGPKTLLEMVGEAGGLNDRAGKKIIVQRPYAGSGQDRVEIDIEELVYDGNPLLNVPLQPGDIVLVPYLQEVRIYVNGAVRNPGMYKFPVDQEATVLQAVTAAGGATDRANESRVNVVRRNSDGTRQVFKVNLNRVKKGKEEDILLEENDTVVVPESFF